MKHTCLYLLLLLIPIQIHCQSDPVPPESPAPVEELPSNYIDSLPVKDLEQFTQDKRYVVIFFYSLTCRTLKCKKQRKRYIKIAKKNLKREIFFVRVGVSSLKKFNQEHKWKLKQLPQFMMSSFGWKKMFSDTNMGHLGIWVREIFDSVPMFVESMDEIDEIDRHYFIYYNKQDLTEEDFEVILLSKLAHPLTIYYGIPLDSPDQEFQKMIRQAGEFDLFSYRGSDSKLFPLRQDQDLYENSSRFKSLEFPKNCKLSRESMVYITHYKLPTFIYFADRPQKQPFYKIYKKVAKKFRKYLMFCTFDYKEMRGTSNDDLKFYAGILAGGISKERPGMVRIVTYDDSIIRYKNFADSDYNSTRLFVKNFLEGTLKPFVADQNLGSKNFRLRKDGIRRINNTKFNEITTHKMDTHLVYVYSSMTKDFQKHMLTLKKLQFALGTNKRFKINILNHDKNDLDGNVHEDLPYVFLSNFNLHRKLYEGPFKFKELFTFLAESLPWLNMNPEFVKDLVKKKKQSIFDQDKLEGEL
jgi:hypothetical protein